MKIRNEATTPAFGSATPGFTVVVAWLGGAEDEDNTKQKHGAGSAGGGGAGRGGGGGS